MKAEDLSAEDTKESALLRVTKDTHTTLTQYRDVVKTLNHGQPLAILGIENQSESNYQMPFRVFEFDFVNYARQIQEISDRHEMERKEKQGIAAEQDEGTDAGTEEAFRYVCGESLGVDCVRL
ncbi:MAG: hypothetical protein LUI13_04995 [Lachnospiraceae bacterium]|nr:hypothetical protein [Lachnospiraceae bacterium]